MPTATQPPSPATRPQPGQRISFRVRHDGRCIYTTAGNVIATDGKTVTVGHIADWSRLAVMTVPVGDIVARRRGGGR